MQGADAQFAKDNRNNVIYTSYYDFAASGLDTTEGTGWAVPDINIVFTLANPQAYEQFKSALKPDLPEGFAVSSPRSTPTTTRSNCSTSWRTPRRSCSSACGASVEHSRCC